MIVLFVASEPGSAPDGASRPPSPDVEDGRDGGDGKIAQLEQELAASVIPLPSSLD
jgi:hypothetical protein